MLPKILRNFNVYVDGHPLAGIAEELTLPDLERETEEYRAAGMLGAVSLDLGMAAMKLEFTLAEFSDTVLKSWGVTDASGIGVRFLGAVNSDSANNATEAVEVSVRGRWKKISQGTVKNGDLAKMKIEMPLTYYKYSSNSDVLVEIDLINGKEVVGGKDRSADLLRALGITS